MQSYFMRGTTSIEGGPNCSSNQNLLTLTSTRRHRTSVRPPRLRLPVRASASMKFQQSHYTVLGVLPNASSDDIKKAYRLLARKYHPDVCKDSGADGVFKRIRLAYEILSDEKMRRQYDWALRYEKSTREPLGNKRWDDSEYKDRFRKYNWSEDRRKARKKYWEQYHARDQTSNEVLEEDFLEIKRGPFTEVLRSVFLSIFLMQTIGIQMSLTVISIMALLDNKLDAGYKVGYVVAWILGGGDGIILAMSLSLASWAYAKANGGLAALVVMAIWVGSHLARYAPHGALITLLYMSLKLQMDLFLCNK